MTIADQRPDIDLYDPASFESGQPHDQFDWLRTHDRVTVMLMAGPPLHTRMRRMVSRDFTPAAARALRPRIDLPVTFRPGARTAP